MTINHPVVISTKERSHEKLNNIEKINPLKTILFCHSDVPKALGKGITQYENTL